MPLLAERVGAEGGHGREGSASLTTSPRKTLGGEEEIHLCKITLVHQQTAVGTGEAALQGASTCRHSRTVSGIQEHGRRSPAPSSPQPHAGEAKTVAGKARRPGTLGRNRTRRSHPGRRGGTAPRLGCVRGRHCATFERNEVTRNSQKNDLTLIEAPIEATGASEREEPAQETGQ